MRFSEGPTEARRATLRALVAAGAAIAMRRLPAAEGRKEMINRPIPLTGELLPVIGIGTSGAFNVGQSANDRGPIEEVLRIFVDGGGRVVDTAPSYGTAETVVGDAASKLRLRDGLFLGTKVRTTGREEGIRQMEDSFRNLRTERIDLMQIHNLVDWRTQLATLRAWKASGRVRYIGITHFRVGAHEEIESILKEESLDFVQLNYSIATRDAEQRLLPLAGDRGAAVIVNRPFEDGELFSRVRGRALPPWASEIGCVSWAQLFLKFVLSNPSVTCVIPATSKAAHMRDNLAAGSGPLPDAALRARMIEAVAAS